MTNDPIPGLAWPAAPKPSLALALLEIAVVFLALAALLFSTDSKYLTVLGPFGVAAIYVIWATAAAFWRASTDTPSKLRVALFTLVQLVSGTVAVAGLGAAVSGVWLQFAYFEKIIDPAEFAFAFPLNLTTIVFLAPGAIAAAAVVFLPAVALLRGDNETVGQCFARIHARGIGVLWPVVAGWLLPGLAVGSILVVAAGTLSLPSVLQAANPSGDIGGWFMVAEFPGFAAAVLAAAILIVAFRRMQPAALAALRGPRRAGARAPATLTVLGSIGAVCGWNIYILHIGMIVALGSNTMIVGWGEVFRATDSWIETRQTAGRETADIASDLRKHGNWITEGPAAGLQALFPELGDNLTDMGLRDDCTVTIDAGVADNTALPEDSWLEGYVAAYHPLPEVSYCIRLACPSPAVWRERPVVILHSSHPSRNRYWAYNVFMDLFGNGAAFEPGGYCTADGNLAAAYQG